MPRWGIGHRAGLSPGLVNGRPTGNHSWTIPSAHPAGGLRPGGGAFRWGAMQTGAQRSARPERAFRRIANVADRGLGRLSRAGSDPTRVASGASKSGFRVPPGLSHFRERLGFGSPLSLKTMLETIG